MVTLTSRTGNIHSPSARYRKRGYILVATCLSLTFLLGVSGLSLDIGRMYIAKNEAQAYVDSAALAAAKQLDGTAAGITRANSAATADTDKWRFDSSAFTNVAATYSNSATGTFVFQSSRSDRLQLREGGCRGEPAHVLDPDPEWSDRDRCSECGSRHEYVYHLAERCIPVFAVYPDLDGHHGWW
jgi:Putative Flp pilus-assembly TadE/G-like